jgi:16S rRNA (cytosine967-C5)-methyltransferase
MSRANPGRIAAGRALLGVETGAHVEDILAELAPPSGPDRGLAWHLALGVLRRQGTVDALLIPHLRTPLERLDVPVQIALRIGAFERAFSRTPPHAAVDQAVELAKALGAGRASGLVNAVVRRVDPSRVSSDPYIDLPRWLAARWRNAPGWVAKLVDPAPLCGVWRDAPVAELATTPAHVGGAALEGAFQVVDPVGAVGAMPGFAEGRWWVMDPAAAAVADLALRAAGPQGTVLDACAAPGGKSLRLASRGAKVVATDQDPARLALIQEASGRTGLSVDVHQHDWLTGPHADLGTFDAVLVDVPCTGLGTVRRHPEIKWRRLPSDPASMALRQIPILEAAAHHVRPGGALIYSVCSPMREEGDAVIRALSGWTVTDRGAAFPPAGNEDAFQAFVLRRDDA